jgi:hypothetical protein
MQAWGPIAQRGLLHQSPEPSTHLLVLFPCAPQLVYSSHPSWWYAQQQALCRCHLSTVVWRATSSAHSRSEVFIFKSFLPPGCIHLRVPSTPVQSPTPPHHLNRHGVIEISRPLPLQAPSLLLTSFPSWRFMGEEGDNSPQAARFRQPRLTDVPICEHPLSPLPIFLLLILSRSLVEVTQIRTNHHVKTLDTRATAS